jgi:archaellum component FlaF (FlaF/FlaG flagellin family)
LNSIFKVAYFYVFFFLAQACFSQVGINTVLPLSTLDVNGNLSIKVVNITGNGSGSGGSSVLITDGIYISINPTAADDKFQLPNPISFPGRMYIIRNINNTTTAQLLTTTGLLFPKNSTTGSTNIYMYEGNLRTVTLISDGANWTYIN